MRATFTAASLLSLAGLASAQWGYGRFPCTIVNGDKTFSPDPTQCVDLTSPGTNDASSDYQGDHPAPTGTVDCVMEMESGSYFCGIAGAACSSDANCDNGHCVGGTCQGGFLQACGGVDSNCSGYLYCLSGDFEQTASDECGGQGAFCQDVTQGSDQLSDAENYAIYNNFCSSGYCNYGYGMCDVHATAVGDDCSTDPQFKCTETSTGQALSCDAATNRCVLAAVPSGRARARRNTEALFKRNVCPMSHTACPIEGSKGFECVDTSSSLESCGGCASTGAGMDCTTLPGVEAVGCVAGTCEIWSCAEGFVWSAESQSCVSA